MILWIVLTLMTAVAAVIVATPFIRGFERRRAESALDLAVYRDQLKEVETEAAQGLIDAAQAEAAKAEIKRRVLAARDGDPSVHGLSGRERSVAAIGVAAVVVGGAITLFALTADLDSRGGGSDEQAEATETEPAPVAQAPAAATPAPASPTGRPVIASRAAVDAAKPGPAKNLPPVDEMVERIVKRLATNPNDVGGWRMLGWSYAGMERYADAADAYAKAIELAPNVAELRSGRADALIRAAGGSVTPVAMILVEEALRIDPRDVRARYYAGLSKEQTGDRAGAIADWKQLATDSDPNDAFVLEVRQKLMALEGASSTAAPAPAAQSPAAQAPVAAIQPSGRGGPNAQDIKNAEAMSPADRQAMIRSMVDGLAARLQQSPHDYDGWMKLLRSRAMLNDKDKAKTELAQALKAFENEPEARDKIAAAGRELGLAN